MCGTKGLANFRMCGTIVLKKGYSYFVGRIKIIVFNSFLTTWESIILSIDCYYIFTPSNISHQTTTCHFANDNVAFNVCKFRWLGMCF